MKNTPIEDGIERTRGAGTVPRTAHLFFIMRGRMLCTPAENQWTHVKRENLLSGRSEHIEDFLGERLRDLRQRIYEPRRHLLPATLEGYGRMPSASWVLVEHLQFVNS